ncbi:hypothetical protein FHS43_005998 [Streptosporangium becharense]|uniref:Uncharacterized protein n=1 Tax=Streptosporangium becharense TaxID=1816182 RepID=A0A7W9IIT0_9ACTN|nr:hypothetical protein [Streptosporangium becharense]MBB2914686.1 hypothetical protein [Streptosporangium becharense]MBB5820913.1 hypothetical protein [Streptosporangium becharense]
MPTKRQGRLGTALAAFTAGASLVGAVHGAYVAIRDDLARSRITMKNPDPDGPRVWGPCQVVEGTGSVGEGRSLLVGVLPLSVFRAQWRFTIVPVVGGRWDLVVPLDPGNTKAKDQRFRVVILDTEAETARYAATSGAGDENSWTNPQLPPRNSVFSQFEVWRGSGTDSC